MFVLVLTLFIGGNVEAAREIDNTELRNNRRIDGVPFALVEGLDLTLELHANGNTTLRIGKGLVSALNDMLGVCNDGGL